MYPNIEDQEIEVKFCIIDPKRIEEHLLAVGATLHQERTHEKNLRFDTPGLDLTRNRRVLRLRQDHRIRLTYKGPAAMHHGISTRKEIEFDASDFVAAKKFIKALGYQVSAIYEKYRTTFLYEELIITIDEMPYGLFLEIEGPDPDKIKEMAHKLELNWQARLEESYLLLFDRAKKALNLAFRDLTFKNFKGLEMGLDDLGVSPADSEE